MCSYGRMLWQWLTVIALTMVPSLVAGPSAGIIAGIHFGFSPWVLLPVVALASFAEGLLVMWLAQLGLRIPWLGKSLARSRTPKAQRWAEKWGAWGGLTLGVAAVGQEPILIALVWMQVEKRRILIPLALSSIAFTAVYFAIVRAGYSQMSLLGSQLKELFDLLGAL
jgi:membrane protein YqaA with SNARE-associated domain